MLNLFDELTTVTQVLDEAGISYALVGGLAYCIWVEARNTEDIDLLIRPEAWPEVSAILKGKGYDALAAPMNFSTIRIRRLTKICDSETIVLDFLLADGPLAEGIEQSVVLTYQGRNYRVAPPHIIVQLKQARLSSKDKIDIEGLQQLIEGQDHDQR